MFKGIKRTMRYLGAWIGGAADRVADPKIQLEQAIEDAKRQHQLLTQQAAAVLGNQRQIEIQLGREMDAVGKAKGAAAQALRLADAADGRGDLPNAEQYTTAAQNFASQLIAREKSVEDMKSLHDKALQAAQVARRAVEQNAYQLQQKLTERSKLLTQLEAAKMQERMNTALESVGELQPKGETPTLDEVRNKIEVRYARAMGVADLQSGSVESKMFEVERASMDHAATARLAEIRQSLHLEAPHETAKVVEKAPGAIEGRTAGALPAGPGAAGQVPATAPQAAPVERAEEPPA